MKQKQTIRFYIVLSIVFALLFSLLYICVFNFYTPREVSEGITIYTDQIGLYKEKSNADSMVAQLEGQQLSAYVYQNENVYVVVSGVNTNEEACVENEKLLKENAYSYVRKKISVYDSEIIEYVENEEYAKALELIGNQS